jgi:hypothetical protein
MLAYLWYMSRSNLKFTKKMHEKVNRMCIIKEMKGRKGERE